MKKLFTLSSILFLFSFSLLKAQTNCGNLGFENGNFGGWDAFTSTHVDLTQVPNYIAGWDTSINGAENILSGNGYLAGLIDSLSGQPDTLISNVCPFTGNFSVRMQTTPFTSINMISYQYYVTNADTNFTYYDAVILSNPHHPNYWQDPYIKVQMFDSSGNRIPFACDSLYPTMSGVPFLIGNGSHYLHWTPHTLNLSGYSGQTINIQFMNSDCYASGHNSILYLDFNCPAISTSIPTTSKDENNISIFSNENSLTVSTPDLNPSSIQVINELGQIVSTENNPSRKTSFNTIDFSNGIYFVRVNTGKEIVVKKFEIVK